MVKGIVLECIISSIVIVYCYGQPVAGPQNVVTNEVPLGINPTEDQVKIENLYNESFLKHTLPTSGKLEKIIPPGLHWPNVIKKNPTKKPSDKPHSITSTNKYNLETTIYEKLGEPVPNLPITISTNKSPAEPSFLEDQIKKTNPKPLQLKETTSKSPLEYKPQKPTYAGVISTGQLEQLIPPGKPWPAENTIPNTVLEDRFKESTLKPAQTLQAEKTTTKSPLEYKPQKPSFAGVISSGQLGQLILPGKPWPADNPIANPVLEDRFKESTLRPEQSLQTEETTTKSPLEYKPLKPSYAEVMSSGQQEQLIPPGKPWPADNPIANPVLEDRFKKSTLKPEQTLQTEEITTKSPLEYTPQKPSFAGVVSSGQVGQLILPGNPGPADNPIANPVLEDRFKESTLKPEQSLQSEETTTSSPLEYKPQKPSFAGIISSGQVEQLIPPGNPWPADDPIANAVLDDRFKETTVESALTSLSDETTTKSPLEYKPQKPFYAGVMSSGDLGPLIPPGKPWPADPPIISPVLEDRFKETTTKTSQLVQPEETTIKSPLEYKPQKPTYAGIMSTGQLGQLIPFGSPLPAEVPVAKPISEDQNKENDSKPSKPLQLEEATPKSPLEYQPQKPSYAGVMSSGDLGPLIPPGKPWPADRPIIGPVLEDRLETTTKPSRSVQSEETTVKSPLEYKPQKPTYAGVISTGVLGQLIPSGSPLPAESPVANPISQDQNKENLKPSKPSQLEGATTKSPLEYQPQKPTYAGVMSSGNLGPLVPPGKPWPADPPILNPVLEDRFKESTAKPSQPVQPEETTIKSPLEYKPQKPTYAGVISTGLLGQLIPSGSPLPAVPPVANPILEDQNKENNLKPSKPLQLEGTTTKPPLEHKPQKPTYSGIWSSQDLEPLIPPGKPWPANPPIISPVLEDRFKESTAKPSQFVQSEETTIKTPLEYKPQKPTYAGVMSTGQLGQLIPSGLPLPAEPPVTNPILEDQNKENNLKPSKPFQLEETTTKSPLEYKPQKPTYAGIWSSQDLEPLIPPGKPWPANPPIKSPVLEDRIKETTAKPSESLKPEETTIKSPLEYKPQKPTYAGVMSTGQLGQLIPSGSSLPADAEPPVTNPIFEDQNIENNLKPSKPLQLEGTTTKSPLEYHPQKPSYAGIMSSGDLGPLIPPGKPWPADPPIRSPVLEDRFKESTAKPSQPLRPEETTIKSPLEYKPQKPTYAGVISTGQLGQLIPSGSTLPADAEPPVTNPIFEDQNIENNLKPSKPSQLEGATTKSPLEYHPQKPSYAGVMSSGDLGPLIPPGKPWPAAPPIISPVLEDRFKESTAKPSQPLRPEETTIKSPLEYKPQKPTYAGVISTGQLGQLIPSGSPLPADAEPPVTNPIFEDQNIENNLKPSKPSQLEGATTKSPLEYHPQKPSYAGVMSSGDLGPLIPPGKPWPADPPIISPVLEDRFKESTAKPSQPLRPEETTIKSPLEYKPQKPTYAGVISTGQLGQLIPSGSPLPADAEPPVTNPIFEDQNIENNLKPSKPLQLEGTATKSPLEYHPHKPSYAGIMSSGDLGPLIPPGKPWPADPPIRSPVLEDRFKESTAKPSQPLRPEETTIKSPLEYKPQKPTYAGVISTGQLGQLIPSGSPLPADAEPPVTNPIFEDQNIENNLKPSKPSQLEGATTKSPLEYHPQKPSYAGVMSSGDLGPLIPPGKPWPADPPIISPVLEDRFKESTAKPSQPLRPEETTIKSPLEYKPQKPTYAGVISTGQLGQLIPSGSPLPADAEPPVTNPIFEDQNIENNLKPSKPLQLEGATTKSPLEYHPQKPSYAGVMSSGDLGPLIPPGKPWPADPPIISPVLEDRFKESTAKPSQPLRPEETTIKSPLEYKPQKPTYAGVISTGQLGQLIPSGLPLPAEPPVSNPILEEQEKENNLKPSQLEETTIKIPLEYMRQKPTYAGIISSGHIEQLIPPGKPWPAEPLIKDPIQKNPSRQRELRLQLF